MNDTLPALVRLGNVPRGRVAVAAVLGALTVLFGAGLMATAGYLISRAAERPAILSLMIAIVVVRVFGLGRPIVSASLSCSHSDRLRPGQPPRTASASG